jgi:hypothetical protein
MLLLALPGQCSAGLEPCFILEGCAWNATDIVVATQQAKSVTVLETWQGNLAHGTEIEKLDLPAMPLEVSSWDKKAPRRVVRGQRVVLFLKHPEATPEGKPAAEWIGAGQFDLTAVSAVWIEGWQAYSLQQPKNPGPLGLWPREPTENNLKQRTLEILAAKRSLAEALLIPDVAQRVKLLEPMAKSELWHQRREAIAAMGKCGPAAGPTLQKLLRHYGKNTPQLVEALAQAAGDQAGAEMTALLQKELIFWRGAAPDLPVGWWNSEMENQEEYQSRYCILQSALKTIEETHCVAARDVVRQMRDLWVSLPQLDDKSGLDQVTKDCNRVLNILDAPARVGS